MVTKAQYEEISKQFRNESCKDPVAKQKLDSKYEYKRVIYTYDKDPNRVERYETEGWEIVISEQESRMSPVTGTLPKSGHKFVLMRCLKDRRKKNEAGKDTRDKAAVARSSKRQEKKVGNQTHITYPEVDLTNNNEQQTEE